MTSKEYRKKYPIGTKIRFLWKNCDIGKIGTIVGFHDGGLPVIFLPESSENTKRSLFRGIEYTWKCRWYEIEPLVIKGQQLLFAFMEE